MEKVYVVLTVDIEEDGPEVSVVAHGYATNPVTLKSVVIEAINSIRSDHEVYMLDDGHYDTPEEAMEDGALDADEWAVFVKRFDDAIAGSSTIIDGGGYYFDLEFPHPKDGKTALSVRPVFSREG